VNQNQEEQQRQALQQELERLEKQIQDLKERQKEGLQDIEAQKQLKEDLLKVTEKLDVKTERNGAVFYDNEHRWAYDSENNKLQQINVNYERATAFCKQSENSHCKTIGDTKGGKWLDSQKIHGCFTYNPEDSKEVWSNLSEKYAREAQGETHTFVKIDSSQRGVWEVAEKPTLQNNQEVTAINYHYHPTPDQEIIRFENLARPEQKTEQGQITNSSGHKVFLEIKGLENNEKFSPDKLSDKTNEKINQAKNNEKITIDMKQEHTQKQIEQTQIQQQIAEQQKQQEMVQNR
jgi:hypothetical protein